MPVAPVRVSNPTTGRTINTYAALDTAAEYSLCSPGLSELLGLEGEEVMTSVVGATGTAENGESLRVELLLQGYRTPEYHHLTAYALPQMTDLREHIPTRRDVDRYPHLRGIQIPVHERKRVDVLVGVAEPHLHHAFER